MGTRKKVHMKKELVTRDVLSRIDELLGLGMSFAKTAIYVNLSESTVSRYARVIKAIHEETNFSSSGCFNWKAIREYCAKLNKPVPQNEHKATHKIIEKEPEQIFPVMDRVRVIAVSNMLFDIAGSLEATVNYIRHLAKYLDAQTKEN